MGTNRENYYLLLGLDISISNPHVIESKINEMEKKWKDLVVKLNKPEHKRLLELIPDIRKCMLNPESRRIEAKAAIIMAVIDPVKYESARKALSNSYLKIEEALKHNNLTDIYDFLSRNPANGNRTGRYNFSEPVEVLIERAKELMESYRNLADSADKMQLASLVADFLQNGLKEAYDVYIMLNVKSSLCNSIDTLVKYNGNKLNHDNLAKLTSESTRLYFTQKDVGAFIIEYCDFRGYTITYATKQSQSESSEQKKQPPPMPKTPDTSTKDSGIKSYVKMLQHKSERLKIVINKQCELIASQKIHANNVQGKQRFQYIGRIKGMVMQQFAFKEYIDLCCILAKANTISDNELKFYELYKLLLLGNSAELDEKVFIREYLLWRYKEQIEQLQGVSADEIVQRMEVIKFD